jgi:hypothetical protein
MKETDLFAPLAAYFEAAGYRVDAEVKNCDLVARKDQELVLVELKTSLNLTLLLQAIERQRLSNLVYIAIPSKALGRPGSRRTALIRVFRRLEIGILTVDVSKGTVQLVALPAPFDMARSRKSARHRKSALLQELAGRSVNLNIAGSTQVPLHTAYREAAFKVLALLSLHGPLNSRQVRRYPDIPSQSTAILYRNFHGWFIRHTDGSYTVSPKGAAELAINSKINSSE